MRVLSVVTVLVAVVLVAYFAVVAPALAEVHRLAAVVAESNR